MIFKQLKYAIFATSLISTSVFADLQKGINAANNGDFQTAISEFQYLVDHDYAPGMYHLAELYSRGLGIAKNQQKAIELYQKAAAQDFPDAIFSLAVIYKEGEGVKVNLPKSLDLFTLAADKGMAAAQYNLGVMYTNGEGTRRNYHAAVKWYTKAASQNYTLAQFNLALMYFEGLGVDKSIEMSYIWNTIAEYNGNKQASHSRKLDEKKLSPSQIELSKEKADEMYYKIQEGKFIGNRRI
ncbi:tetratricopeptide repeat protein [Pseudoalteromonas denitrificans]|nr:tetratricopeptide repeat protein [Pseudoalteromonas denitrificans]